MKWRKDLQRAMWSLHSHAVREHLFGSTRFLRAAPLGDALKRLSEEKDEHQPLRLRIAETSLRGERRERGGMAGEPVWNQLERAKGEVGEPKCEVVVEPVKAELESPGHTVSFKTRSRVNRRLSEMRPILDPRGWGYCSDFFDPERTYRLRVENDRPVRDRRGIYIRDDGTEPLGVSWNGLMRERFDGPGVAVDNILAINFDASDEQVDVKYALYASESCTLGLLNDIGGLLKNSGGAHAYEEEERTVVEVTKTLRVVDYTPGETGNFVDFGEALSMLMAVMGVALVNDKFVLRLCCEPGNIHLQTEGNR